MQFGDDVYERVVQLLREGYILRSVDFSIEAPGRIEISARGFRLVGEMIQARAITLAEFWQHGRVQGRGEAAAEYVREKDMMLLNPAKVESGLKNGAELWPRLAIEGAIVHEAVHAMFDVLKQPVRSDRDEAVAYLAEELFWRRSFGGKRDVAGYPIRMAAQGIIDAFDMANHGGTVLTGRDIRPLAQAVREHPLYYRRFHPFNRRRVPYDGVRP